MINAKRHFTRQIKQMSLRHEQYLDTKQNIKHERIKGTKHN